jgi:hypothetical protein
VADSDALTLDEDPDHVEPVRVVRSPMAGDPDARRASQLFLFPPVDRFDRTAEPIAAPSLDLDERHQPIPLDHQIDVAMSGAEAALYDAPAPSPKPSLRDPLSQLAE